MNRTASVFPVGLFCLCLCAAAGRAQEPAAKAADAAQDAALADIVASLQRAEAAAKTVRLELSTEGHMPGGLDFRTRAVLRVLNAAQGGMAAVQSTAEYTFADGLTGRIETVKTPDGVLVNEQNPTFGEVFVRIDKSIVADIEWAGRVLQRTDLPGLADTRAAAPLGSAMVADLARRYALRPLGSDRNARNGEAGRWYGGDRRPGPAVEGEDQDAPMADHVELVCRESDKAVLEVVYLQAGKVAQRIAVEHLVLDEPMPLESFKLDDKGKRPLNVKEHPPMWQQIEELLQRAEQQAADAVQRKELPPEDALPPSKRK
jgi:hypothetical protein